MLLQIAEPGQSASPHEHKLAVGIDLGTTNSLVATVQSGSAKVLSDATGKTILPSAVHYGESRITVGEKAKKDAPLDAANTLISVKRFLGQSFSDVSKIASQLPYEFTNDNDVLAIKTRQGNINPIQASCEILKTLRTRAEDSFAGEAITGAVITVPAYFDDAQRQGTKDAAELAGLKVMRLLNEPTAAAVAYGLDSGKEGVIAVYDLGGGTFDVALVQMRNGILDVIDHVGDNFMGGKDIDQDIVKELICKPIEAETDQEKLYEQLIKNQDSSEISTFISYAEETKKILSIQNTHTFEVYSDSLDIDSDIKISKVELDKIIIKHFNRRRSI